jgi:hypothetical protein
MSLREHADAFFARLSSKLGEGDLSLDEEGRAVFSLGETIFSAALVEEAETLVLSALIGRLPSGPRRGAALRKLARANFNWGGTDGGVIGLEEGTDLAFLHRRFFPLMERAEDFPGLVAGQLTLARHWAAQLNETETAGPPPIEASALRV